MAFGSVTGTAGNPGVAEEVVPLAAAGAEIGPLADSNAGLGVVVPASPGEGAKVGLAAGAAAGPALAPVEAPPPLGLRCKKRSSQSGDKLVLRKRYIAQPSLIGV